MKINSGLMSGQVLQRNLKGKGSATVNGRCSVNGTVEFRVLKAGKPTGRMTWKSCGEATKKSFQAELTEIKTGGPYQAELRITDGRKVLAKTTVEDLYVGDVWILAGQSNMQGVGNLCDKPKPHPQVRAFYMRDEWGMAEEKLHFLEEAVDEVHSDYGNGPNRPSKKVLNKKRADCWNGVGPGLPFALEMQRKSKVPQGLICCAHGGTSMDQWSPDLKDEGGKSLYGAMMRRFDKLGQPVAGVLWYQGESDAHPKIHLDYTSKMVSLVDRSRGDMNLPNLPWCVVQIGRHTSTEMVHEWNSIQEQQRCLPNVIKSLDVTSTIDLDLDDGIHVSGKDQGRLGSRLARIARRLVHHDATSKKGVSLKSVLLVPTSTKMSGADAVIEVSYNNVAGSLDSQGLPTGFALIDQNGKDTCSIYKTILKGNKVFLYSNMSTCQLEVMSLSYGHGKSPYCNITDKDRMSLPGMKNISIGINLAKYGDTWQTRSLDEIQNFNKLNYSKASEGKGWRKAPPRAGFGVLPKAATSNKIGFYSMRTTIGATEPLQSHLFFGTNVPFKVWLNGKAILEDLDSCPPLNIKYQADLNLKEGKNELLVVLKLNRPAPYLGLVAQVGTKERKLDSRISF